MVVAGLCLVLAVAPSAFLSKTNVNLVKIRGHIAELKMTPGTSNYKNTFVFTLKERPELIFSVDGLRLSDQAILVDWESYHDEFSVEVSSAELSELPHPLHVYGFATASIAFVKSDNLLAEAWKAKLFLVCIELLMLCALGWAIVWLRRKYLLGNFEAQPVDSFLLLAAAYPGKCLVGVLSGFLFLSLLIASWRFILAQFLVSGLIFLGFFLWRRSHPMGIAWLNALRERQERQIASMTASRIVTAAPKHVQAVQALLQQSGGHVDIRDAQGRTPLIVSSSVGQAEAVGLLLRSGANVNAVDAEGNTSIMVASDNGYLGIVMKLVGAGGKVTLQNNKGLTALMMAQLSKKNKALLDYLATSEVKEKIAEAKEARLLEEKLAQEAKAAQDAQILAQEAQAAEPGGQIATSVSIPEEVATEAVLPDHSEKKEPS